MAESTGFESKRRLSHWINTAIMVVILILIVWSFSYMVGYSESFRENPFVFGASQIAKNTNSNVYCTCSLISHSNQQYRSFSFTEYNITYRNPDLDFMPNFTN